MFNIKLREAVCACWQLSSCDSMNKDVCFESDIFFECHLVAHNKYFVEYIYNYIYFRSDLTSPLPLANKRKNKVICADRLAN